MRRTLEIDAELRVADDKGRVLLGKRYAGQRFAMREEEDGSAVLTPVVMVPAHGARSAPRLAERFADLGALRDDWDGHGSSAPAPALICRAREVVALLQAGTQARGLLWTEPHLGANERGQVVLEWWQGGRTLTLFVRSEDQVDYLKTWGSHIQDEMEDGEVSRLADFLALSQWLSAGRETGA